MDESAEEYEARKAREREELLGHTLGAVRRAAMGDGRIDRTDTSQGAVLVRGMGNGGRGNSPETDAANAARPTLSVQGGGITHVFRPDERTGLWSHARHEVMGNREPVVGALPEHVAEELEDLYQGEWDPDWDYAAGQHLGAGEWQGGEWIAGPTGTPPEDVQRRNWGFPR
jgi:hypothetical protein